MREKVTRNTAVHGILNQGKYVACINNLVAAFPRLSPICSCNLKIAKYLQTIYQQKYIPRYSAGRCHKIFIDLNVFISFSINEYFAFILFSFTVSWSSWSRLEIKLQFGNWTEVLTWVINRLVGCGEWYWAGREWFHQLFRPHQSFISINYW